MGELVAHGPSDFPFDVDDRVAVRVLAPTGDAWFPGTLTARGSGGILVVEAGGTLRMWVPWDQAVVRDVDDDEWNDAVDAAPRRGPQ